MIQQESSSFDIFNYLTRTDLSDISSVKDINYIKILNLIHTERAISRASIARKLNLSKTTVSSVVNKLLRDNVIREIGLGESYGGRKPLLLEFNTKIKVSIGIEIDDNLCIGILTDLYAHPIQDPIFKFVEDSLSNDHWRGEKAVLATINELKQDVDPGSVLGVCIGIPGIYDETRETIMIAESLGLDHFAISNLRKLIDIPIKIINRANAAALGEKWYGIGRKFQNMMYVSIGGGIGAGIIINNELFKGSSGSAGEIGHTTILPTGPLCRCGSNGCLESLVSSSIILSLAREFVKKDHRCQLRQLIQNDPERINLQAVLEAAQRGDTNCRKLIKQQGEYLGIAIANALNLLDLQLVIIGGELGCILGEVLLPHIKDTVRLRAPYLPRVEIEVSKLGMLAASIGASAYLIGS